MVSVQWFVATLDARNEEERWRWNRNWIDAGDTACIVEREGRRQVIAPGMDQAEHYNLKTGEAVWRSRGIFANAIPSAVHTDGIASIRSGYRGNNQQAAGLLDARGTLGALEPSQAQLCRNTPCVP